MARDRNGTHHEEDDEVPPSKIKSKHRSPESSDSDSEDDRKRVKSDKRKRKSGKRRRSRSDEDSESEYSSSASEYSDSESESESESEEERRARKRKERKRRREKEEERERKRRKREKERRKREKEKKEKRKKKKKEKLERGKRGAVTNSWGKYGIIRETDMWNKRPEFTAWLAEVKQVNLESLPNWEEKQMFKQFMEDHNTATFPSKKYYNLDAYHKRQMEKELKRGSNKVSLEERTIFNDEEQRRLELQQAREKQKEEEVEALKRSMQSGMAQAMKEQAQLREEMAYQYKLGNFEAAAAIQRRLDPDVAM
ncbi:vicilin-like seed storage protein At2g18540 [Mangifera indica]|uniref:vicilin-like seed storage protein At2g18540 n=1 Tax=Mangifera indica TaxID=29780 RepID=UPI001CFBB7CB|nr:vicilin-like seed storage protein At2g18540 [Mangifera indica]